MEFPAFEWIRISRKWNISAARKQLELGQLKCSNVLLCVRCSAETAKIYLMVFLIHVEIRSGAEISNVVTLFDRCVWRRGASEQRIQKRVVLLHFWAFKETKNHRYQQFYDVLNYSNISAAQEITYEWQKWYCCCCFFKTHIFNPLCNLNK